MRPERMNAFTDGVIAILFTILVVEPRPPDRRVVRALGLDG